MTNTRVRTWAARVAAAQRKVLRLASVYEHSVDVEGAYDKYTLFASGHLCDAVVELRRARSELRKAKR